MEPDLFECEELTICECGNAPLIADDAMSLLIVCGKCGLRTEEYLYGASSCNAVNDQIIKDWNAIISNRINQKDGRK